MQKGTFNTWLKELCALVFMQTIQAFVLAIVLSIIITFLVPGGGAITEYDTVSALGVLCIILLGSITKMEQITKKIFGLDSSFMQQKPPHGLMTSYLALKAAGRALNNLPKIASGIGKISGSRVDKRKALNRNLTRLARAGIGVDGNPLEQSQGQPLPDENSNEQQNSANEQQQNGGNNGQQGNQGNQGNSSSSTVSTGSGNSNGNVASRSNDSSSNKSNSKTNENYWKIMDKYDDEIDKAKQRRREGIKELSSGLLETGGAITGVLGGTAVGLSTGIATGDLDQIPKAIGYGVGLGDAVGEFAINAVDAVDNQVASFKKARKTTKELKSNLSKMEENLKIQQKSKTRASARFKAIQDEIKRTNNISDI